MPTVLLVEDEADQLHMRTLIFENSGYDVRTAQTAQEARILTAGVDAVVMDLCIPRLEDGLSLIDFLRGSAPIVVLTGDENCQDLNVNLQLHKPCSSRVLLDAVGRLVK